MPPGTPRRLWCCGLVSTICARGARLGHPKRALLAGWGITSGISPRASSFGSTNHSSLAPTGYSLCLPYPSRTSTRLLHTRWQHHSHTHPYNGQASQPRPLFAVRVSELYINKPCRLSPTLLLALRIPSSTNGQRLPISVRAMVLSLTQPMKALLLVTPMKLLHLHLH